MTIQDAQEKYNYNSGKASDLTRQLSLAGLAVVWLFKFDKGGPRVPSELFVPAGIFILALFLDYLQYAYASAAWGYWGRAKEKSNNDESKAPRAINWPTIAFFWAKLAATSAAYVLLLNYAAHLIF